MDTKEIIQEIYFNEPKRKNSYMRKTVQRETEHFITDRWQDSEGNIYHKTYNKEYKYTMYSKNGFLHNIDGPAVIKNNGTVEWWYEDNQVAIACDNPNFRKFSVNTPVDESMIRGSISSLDLMTVLRAKESYEQKKANNADFILNNNIGLVINNMRNTESEDNKNSNKPK